MQPPDFCIILSIKKTGKEEKTNESHTSKREFTLQTVSVYYQRLCHNMGLCRPNGNNRLQGIQNPAYRIGFS